MGSQPASSNQRLYRQVVEKMLLMLESAEYPPGSRLPPERELSERFHVSRPTIREAIIALEVMGKVGVKTGSGVYVLEQRHNRAGQQVFSPFELTEARILFEGEAAALAATMITDEQIEELKSAFEAMEIENDSGDAASQDADRHFHLVISQATHNRVLIDTIIGLWDIQERSPEIQFAHASVCKQEPKTRLDEHKAILDALVNREPNKARLAMRRHFSRLVEAMHDATEAEAVEEVRKKVLDRRQRFSLNRLD
jgi:DNA-binding FadR family transcriptional regulator